MMHRIESNADRERMWQLLTMGGKKENQAAFSAMTDHAHSVKQR
jgi:hypothetical protein